jgi:hypothetical protein
MAESKKKGTPQSAPQMQDHDITIPKDISSLNIYEKMSLITNAIKTVGKNLDVGNGKNKYKGVDESDVLTAVKPIEFQFRVYSYPCARKPLESQILETENQYGKKYSKFIRLETTYRFVNIDKPEEYIDITTYGDGVDPQDKAPGKAMTYADKYALLKGYKIRTGEDTDAEMSQQGRFISTEEYYTQVPPHEEPDPVQQPDLISEMNARVLIQMCENHGKDVQAMCAHYGVKSVLEMSDAQFTEIVQMFDRNDKKAKNARTEYAQPVNPTWDAIPGGKQEDLGL